MNSIDTVEELFEKYKKITISIIEKFNNDADIQEMLADRQNLLNKINDVDIPGYEKKRIYESMEIDKLDKKLGETLKDSLEKIKEDIRMNKMRRNTTNAYNNVLRQQSLFSKKV